MHFSTKIGSVNRFSSLSPPANGKQRPVHWPSGTVDWVPYVFEEKDGWIYVTRDKIEASRPEILKEPLGDTKKITLYVCNDHMGNFFKCIQTRNAPICDAVTGHRSVSVCHLGVIAIRLGRELTWDPEKERFAKDMEADGFLQREMRKPWTYDMVK